MSDSYDMLDRFLRNNLADDDYAEYSDALNQCCTSAPAIPAGWQSIETAPKNGRDLIIFNDELIRIGFFDVARDGVWSIWPGRAQASPTHWMPLPAAPKGETA